MSDTYTLTPEERTITEDAYSSTDPTILMSYGYAFGRMDVDPFGVRITVPGIGKSDMYTALWFASLYTLAQQEYLSYGHFKSWEVFVESGGRKVK